MDGSFFVKFSWGCWVEGAKRLTFLFAIRVDPCSRPLIPNNMVMVI